MKTLKNNLQKIDNQITNLESKLSPIQGQIKDIRVNSRKDYLSSVTEVVRSIFPEITELTGGGDYLYVRAFGKEIFDLSIKYDYDWKTNKRSNKYLAVNYYTSGAFNPKDSKEVESKRLPLLGKFVEAVGNGELDKILDLYKEYNKGSELEIDLTKQLRNLENQIDELKYKKRDLLEDTIYTPGLVLETENGFLDVSDSHGRKSMTAEKVEIVKHTNSTVTFNTYYSFGENIHKYTKTKSKSIMHNSLMDTLKFQLENA